MPPFRSSVITCATGVVATTVTVNVPDALAMAVVAAAVEISAAVAPFTEIVVLVLDPTVYETAVLGVRPETLNVTEDWLGATVYALIPAAAEVAATVFAASTTVVVERATDAAAVAIDEAATVVTVRVFTPRVPRVPCGVAVNVDVDAAVTEFV